MTFNCNNGDGGDGGDVDNIDDDNPHIGVAPSESLGACLSSHC